ncbi:MAG: hypothetical protein AAB649_06300, partial [Patescibacteria group bacterium]
MPKRVGFSYWGFCEELYDSSVIDTPDGGRYSRPILAKKFQEVGFDIICLQQRREMKPLSFLQFSEGFPELDAIFLEWRWPTYKNDINHPDFGRRAYEPDLDRQRDILKHYYGRVPIVIFDTDLKLQFPNFIEKESLHKNGVVVCEPAIFHSHFAEFLPYWSDFKPVFNRVSLSKRAHVYIGSNYERYWGVEKYYFSVAKNLRNAHIDVATTIRGNWLDESPERPEQMQKVEMYSSYIDFFPRANIWDSFHELANAIATTHIGKMSYMRVGNVASRFTESIVCNTPGLVPSEFLIPIYGHDWIVYSPEDVIEKLLYLRTVNDDGRDEIVASQAA